MTSWPLQPCQGAHPGQLRPFELAQPSGSRRGFALSHPIERERFGPRSSAPFVAKQAESWLLGHTRDAEWADALPRSPSLSAAVQAALAGSTNPHMPQA